MRDTIEMAREAELVYWLPNSTYTNGRWWSDAGEPGEELKAFEALVRADERNRTWTQEHWTEYERSIAAAEREACAELADRMDACQDGEIGKAIRARGNT